MKIWSSEHVFNHPWENVVKAALQKYPNPYNPSVIGVDVIDRTIENRVLKSHRLMATQWQLPSWCAKILGGNRTCYASEHSQVDLDKKEFLLRSRNLTFNNIIHVDEKLTYSIHPDDHTKTILKQEAQINVKNAPLIDYLENMMANKMNSNAKIGRQAIEFIIHNMNNITDAASNVAQFSKSV